MPAFLLEEVAYSPSHILSTPLYIPQNILENMRIFPSIISLIHPRGAKNERLKAKKWRTGAILLKLFARTPTRSCPRCQHSYYGSTSGTKSPKRRDNAWNMQDETVINAGISSYSGFAGWSAGTVPQDPLYSAEYSGTRSFGGPSIFQMLTSLLLPRYPPHHQTQLPTPGFSCSPLCFTIDAARRSNMLC